MDDVAQRRCKCGHAKGDFWIRPAKKYSFWSTFALLAGVTPRPSRVDFDCGICGETVESITDPATLEKYRYEQG